MFVFGVATTIIVFSFSSFFRSAATIKLVEVSKEATSTAILAEPNAQASSSGEMVAVTRVIDGDTIEIEGGKRVRYIGIDTPETVDPRKALECFGREASEENRRLVDSKTVRLEKDISQIDRYGRLLRYVYIDDVMINEALVRGGFAHASTFPPDIKYQQQFLNAEREARENGRGLWAGCSINNPTPEVRLPQSVPLSGSTPEEREFAAGQLNPSCVIKGNISTNGEKIYHLSGCGSYDKTSIDESKGERWFCSEDEAQKAGWRKAKNCP